MAESDPNIQAATIEFKLGEDILASQLSDVSEQLSNIEEQLSNQLSQLGRYAQAFGDLGKIGSDFNNILAESANNWPSMISGVQEAETKAVKTFRDRIALHEEEIDYLEKEVQLRTEYGLQFDEHIEQLDIIGDKLQEMYANQGEFNRMDIQAKQRAIAASLKVSRLSDELKEATRWGSKLEGFLSDIGAAGIAGTIAGLSTISFWMGSLVNTTKEYLQSLSQWTSRNYTLYGTLAQVADGVREVQLNTGLLADEARDASRALMEMLIDPDSLQDLAGSVGILHSESGIAVDIIARLTKGMQVMGATTAQIDSVLGGVLVGMDEMGLNSSTAATMVEFLSDNTATLISRLGGAKAFEQFSEKALGMAGAMSQAGIKASTIGDIFTRALKVPQTLVTGLEQFDIYTTPDQLVENILTNSGKWLNIIRDAGPLAGIVADRLGITEEALTRMVKSGEIYNKTAVNTLEITEAEAMQALENRRKEQDVRYQLQRMWDSFKSVMYDLLYLLNPIFKGITYILEAISNLDNATKHVLGYAALLGSLAASLLFTGKTLSAVYSKAGGLVSKFTGLVSRFIGPIRTGAIWLARLFGITSAGTAAAIVGVVALAGAAAWLWAKLGAFAYLWEGIKAFGSGIAEGFMVAVGQLSSAWDELAAQIDPQIWQALKIYWDNFWDAVADISEWLNSGNNSFADFMSLIGWGIGVVLSQAIWVIVAVIKVISTAITVIGWIYDKISGLWDLITSGAAVIGNVIGWFGDLIDSIFGVDDALVGHSLVPSLGLLMAAFEAVADIIGAVFIPIMDTIVSVITGVEDIILGISNDIVTLVQLGPGKLFETAAGLTALAGSIAKLGVALLGASVGAGAFVMLSRLAGEGRGVSGILRRLVAEFDFSDVNLDDAVRNVHNIKIFMDDFSDALWSFTESNLLTIANKAVEWFKNTFGGGNSSTFNELHHQANIMNATIKKLVNSFTHYFSDVDLSSIVAQMDLVEIFVAKYDTMTRWLSTINPKAGKLQQLSELFEEVQGDAIVTVKADIDDKQATEKSNMLMEQLLDRANILIEAVKAGHNDEDNEFNSNLLGMLSKYLPELVAQGEGKLITTSQWK